MKRATAFVAAAAGSLIGLCGCDGDSTPSAPSGVIVPTPTPALSPPQILLQASFALEAGFFGVFRTVTVSAPGAIDMAVNWTLASNNLDLALVRGTCTGDQFDAGACDPVAFSQSLAAKPERTRIVVPPGTYTPVILNVGPGSESGILQMLFTEGAIAELPSCGSLSVKPRYPQGLVRRSHQ